MIKRHHALSLFALAALALGDTPVRAQNPNPTPPAGPNDFLMLYGYVAPAGSMTAESANTSALYLFWGTDDTDLVALGQGASITLERDGEVVLGPFAFGDVASEAAIAALYAGPAQGRRLSETMHALDDMFAGDAPVTPQTFPKRLRDLLLGQGGCPGLQVAAASCSASLKTAGDALARIDANVASAKFMGYRTTVPAAPTTWVLRATSGTTTRVLGTVNIDPSVGWRQLPPPSALADVSLEQQRCDAPGLDAHGVLALSWAHPEVSPAVAKISAHNIAGYHVFAGDCTGEPVDLHALAAMVPHDTHGGFVLPGLVRLTDTLAQAGDLPPVDGATGRRLGIDPLTLGGSSSFVPPPGYANPTTPGWRPTFAQLVASAEVVSAAGFLPGQEVCVHIAAVDRAGQLGATATVQARVADFEKPPSPWDVTTLSETSRDFDLNQEQYYDSKTFALEWPAMDASSWLARDGSVACNPAEAAQTRRLVSAPTATDCGDATKAAPVDLAIEKYLVYRFEGPREAGTFFDTDGDGCADLDERTSDDDPGTACTDAQVVCTTQHLVGSVLPSEARVDPATGRLVLRFVDSSPDSPANNVGEVSWYAIAAQDTSGWVGPMSAPVRALFADKLPVARPLLEDVTFGTCEPELVASELVNYPVIAGDLTDDRLAANGKLRLYCVAPDDNERSELMRIVDGYVGEAPFVLPTKTDRWIVTVDEPGVEELVAETLTRRYFEWCQVYAEVVDPNGRLVARSDPAGDLATGGERPTLGILLFDGCTTTEATPIQPGQVVDGKVHIKLPTGTPEGTCGDLEIEDGGMTYRVATVCGNDTLAYEVPDTGGKLQCYSLVLKGQNQVPAMPLSLPCVKAKTSIAPAPPQLDQLLLPHDQVKGSIRWKAPGAAVAGIIVQLENRTAGTFRSDFFAAGGETDPTTGFATDELVLGAVLAPGATEQWCVRARSLSAATSADLGGQLSDWAGPFCGSRVPPNTPLPSYLPWPTMTEPPVRSTLLAASYLGTDALPYITLGDFDPNDVWPPSNQPDEAGDCGWEQIPTCYSSVGLDGYDERCLHDDSQVRSECIELCMHLDKAAGDFRKVVGYRQTQDPGSSTWGPWIQVTAYIERAFCFFDVTNTRPLTFSLFDASFAAVRFLPLPSDDPSFATYKLIWVDRHPHEPGTKIRYQFVRFGAEGQIVETMPTSEVDIPAEVMP